MRRREKHKRGGSAHLCTHLKSNVGYCFLHHLGRIVSVLLCCAACALHAVHRGGGLQTNRNIIPDV